MMTTVEAAKSVDPGEEWSEGGYMTCFQIFMKGVDIFSVDLEERM